MKRIAFFLAVVAVIFGFAATPALAQATRVFVSTRGLDTSACSVAAPCRTFQHAHDVATANGEIDVLDPGGYGAVNITKSISIVGHGFSGVSVASGNAGITINGANAVVNLNGLLVEGSGLGETGISFSSGSNLTIKDCVIRNMAADGINFIPTASSGSLSVSHSWVGNNGGYGIFVRPTGSATATVVFDGVTMQYNSASYYGLLLDASFTTGKVTGTVTDSVSSDNGGGFQAKGSTGAVADSASLMLVRSVAANNHTGLQAGDFDTQTGIIRLSEVTIAGNVVDWINFTGGPGVFSYGDNNIDGNGSTSGSPTLIAKK
jgi:hypothetical protein